MTSRFFTRFPQPDRAARFAKPERSGLIRTLGPIDSAMSMSHPYEAFETDPLWQMVKNALHDLVENGDVSEQTSREYIVGYIVKAIRESGEPVALFKQ